MHIDWEQRERDLRKKLQKYKENFNQGLPFGMQIIGPRYSEYRMFDLLNQLVLHAIAPEVAPIVDSQVPA